MRRYIAEERGSKAMTWKYTETPATHDHEAFEAGAWQLIDAEGIVIGEFRGLVLPEVAHGKG